MSEGPYRNMSYEDAANAMSRIYKLLYPRKFHSYNPSLDEPFADYVGTRKEKDPIPEEYTKFYGKIGNVMEKYTPILGDISYGVDETADIIPANASKVILDLHGMAILNSLLEVAELGARYIGSVTTQISKIKDNLKGVTVTTVGNAFANKYLALFDAIDTEYISKYGSETLTRVKNMITKLSSATRSGVIAKNVEDYQVGQEEVISDAFDKDFLEYFIMYLDAENNLHDKVKADYDIAVDAQRKKEITDYVNNKGKVIQVSALNKGVLRKFPKYVDISGCRSSCVGLCVASCANTCFGCSDRCSGQCTATCADCTNGCMNACVGTCQGTCKVECIGCSTDCDGGCIDACSNACGGTCTKGCHTDCAGSCFGTAEGFVSECGECGSTCKGTCGNSCKDTTSSITPGPDPKPPTTEIEPEPPDPPIHTEPDPPPPTDPSGYQPQGGPGNHPSSGWVPNEDGTGYWIHNDGYGNIDRTPDMSPIGNGGAGDYTTPWDGSDAGHQYYPVDGGSGGGSGSGSGGGNYYDRGNNPDGTPWYGNDPNSRK